MRGVPQLHYFVISMGGCPAVGAAAGVGIIGDIGSRPSMDIHGLGPWAVGSTCCHDFFTGIPGVEISALVIVKVEDVLISFDIEKTSKYRPPRSSAGAMSCEHGDNTGAFD